MPCQGGFTSLDLAASNGQEGVLRLLMGHTADKSAVNKVLPVRT